MSTCKLSSTPRSPSSSRGSSRGSSRASPRPLSRAVRSALVVVVVAGGLSSWSASAKRVAPDGEVAPAPPQAAVGPQLRVGISPIAPFVFVEDPPRGFSVDLIREVAKRLGREPRFVSTSGVTDNLAAVAREDVDVAIGAISITERREEQVDFTFPMLRTGLGLMVREEATEVSYSDAFLNNWSQTRGKIVFGFLLLIIIAGHLVWFAERGAPAFDDKYFPGVFEGMYWAIVTASTVGYGDKAPVRWPGRIVAALVIVISLPLFAVFTAELSSALTVEAVTSRIQSPSDLRERSVGVVAGTTGAKFGASQELTLRQYDDVTTAVQALRDSRVDAVIYDAPTLKYLQQQPTGSGLFLVADDFDPQDLAFAVAEGSALREKVNRVLLTLREEGLAKELRLKWFGE